MPRAVTGSAQDAPKQRRTDTSSVGGCVPRAPCVSSVCPAALCEHISGGTPDAPWTLSAAVSAPSPVSWFFLDTKNAF